MVVEGMERQSCESCGREFSCATASEARGAPCWCAELALTAERLAVLREHFEHCLCPDCLGIAAGQGPRGRR